MRERNHFAMFLIMMWAERPATKGELLSGILLATSYQQRARKNRKSLAMADKMEVFRSVYFPARKTGTREDVYKIMESAVRKAKKEGLLTEPVEGWYDITEEGMKYLYLKKARLEQAAVKSINYFASTWKANRTRNRQYIEKRLDFLKS